MICGYIIVIMISGEIYMTIGCNGTEFTYPNMVPNSDGIKSGKVVRIINQ